MLFKSIMDHKSTEKDFKKSDGYISLKNQTPELRNTTKGWEFLIEWADGIMIWKILSYIKELLLDKVLEYDQGSGTI